MTTFLFDDQQARTLRNALRKYISHCNDQALKTEYVQVEKAFQSESVIAKEILSVFVAAIALEK